jgi:hypothetical protein
MKPSPNIERVIYAAFIILALAAVGLAFISPAEFINLKLIYGGF